MNLKTRILFVDDEPLILEMLQLSTGLMKGDWDMRFVQSAEQALELMGKEAFDLVVSDMRMPGMSGGQLLNEVMRRYPATLRIILSGYSDKDQVMRSVGATHQFLSKPLEINALQLTLYRIKGLKMRLPSEEIQKLLANKDSLPSIPAVYFKIVEALQDADCPVERIGGIVATDPGLTAKVLQLVNSAFFGFAREVSNANEAVMLLGVGIIRSLALSLHLFSAFKGAESEFWSAERVWAHSMRVGRFAKRIVELEGGDEQVAEQAFTAGILHDVGQLILADTLGTPYLDLVARSAKEQRPLTELEQECVHANHEEVAAFLLDLWGLPAPLVEAVAFHHHPGKAVDPKFSPLTAVHVANVFEQQDPAAKRQNHVPKVDSDYLERLKLTQRVPIWREKLM